jgi:DNA-binding MarR family transcriptional regulator
VSPTKNPSGSAPDDVYRLLKAVAGPRHVYLLTVDLAGRKHRGARVSWRAAASSGLAFMCQLRSDVVGLDADTPQAVKALDELAEALLAEGHQPVLVNSGRVFPDSTPGRHLFVRLADPHRRRQLRATAAAAGVDDRSTGWIRSPLAPHPAGRPVALADMTVDDAVAALSAIRPEGRLSPRMRTLLRRGDTAGRYKGDSEVAMALATAAVNAGIGWERWARMMCHDGNAGGASAQKRSGKVREDWLWRTWEKAVDYVTSNPPVVNADDARRQLGEIRAAIAASADRWRGQAGATNRAVLEAHLQVAEEIGAVAGYHLAVRSLAERAGINKDTACAANQRLVEQGWLHREWIGRGTAATRWRLDAPAAALEAASEANRAAFGHTTHAPPGQSPEVRASGTLAWDTLSHDVWRYGGLGKNGLRVAAELDHGHEPSAASLTQSLHLHPSTVTRALERGRLAGLFQRSDQGQWQLVGPVEALDLNQAAQVSGTHGRGARARALHEAERARRAVVVHEWLLEERREGRLRQAQPFRQPLPDENQSGGRLFDPETGEIVLQAA